jgi:pyridoxamine 5'-phosphate oxidase
MAADLSILRTDYAGEPLTEHDVHSDPVIQFEKWLDQALDAQVAEPNAMTLSTADAHGQPSGRIVLLKGLEQGGFVFYTNYGSRKGREIEQNPKAALTFFWHELARQVRIEGTLYKVSAQTSDNYFKSRPLESRIGARVSPQSQVIPNRQWLEDRFSAESQHPDPARPAHWGGYVLKPHFFEFWQGRPSRLHDRIRYLPAGESWKIERLAP